MIKSRLQEHYQRIIRDDMLNLFGRIGKVHSLECSIILQGAMQLTEQVKYRSACIMEILTGQRPKVMQCRVEEEDPGYVKKSEEEERRLAQIQGAMLHKSSYGKGAGGGLTAADYKSLGTGMEVRTVLRRQAMWDFLEKMREFYLPDILLIGGVESTLAGSLKSDGPAKYFQVWNKSKLPHLPRLLAIPTGEHPQVATTAFVVGVSDLLKLPDIEHHFGALGNSFGGDGSGEHSANNLRLILRPTLQVHLPVGLKEDSQLPFVDNLKVMNYLLSNFFNPYINRPILQREH